MTDNPSNAIHTVSTTHVVYAVLRFLRVVRHRKTVIFASLVVTCLLGAIYYATAERIYAAKAQLLVLSKDPAVWNESIAKDGNRQGMLPTYERLFSSAKVLNRAIDALDGMPQEARIDLVPFPREKWLEEMRERLNASAVRSTNIIEISYLSGRPRTAETVVNAVVQSYTDFIEESHRSVAGEIADLLQVDMARVEQRLQEKTAQLFHAKQAVRDIGIAKSDVVHPLVKRVEKTHADLVDSWQERIRLQSSLAALQNAIQNGGNLQQHILALEPTVGQEVMLGAMGLSTADGEVRTHLKRMLFEEQAKLEQLSAYYLDNHPQIQQLSSSVSKIQEQIAGYGTRRSEMGGEEYNRQLGEMLVSLVSEQLQQTWMHEQALRQEFDSAEQDAMRLASQWEGIRILEKQEQRLRDLDATLQTRLDNIDIKTNQSDVRVAIVSDAVADNRPVSPRLLWVAFVCGAVGSCVGIGVIYVLDVLDDRFRSPEELREQLGAPVLAIIRQLPETEDMGAGGLHVHTAPDSIESEAFRTLRTTLAFSGGDVDCMAVSSSEPSDGKTTVLSNLGVAASDTGCRTLLIDADMRRPGLSKLFEVRGEKGLGNLLRGEDDVVEMAEGFVMPTGVPNMDMIPAGIRPVDPTGMLSGPRFAELLAWARSTYDQVLIDTPPILAASDATIIGRLVDGLMLVVQPEKNNRRWCTVPRKRFTTRQRTSWELWPTRSVKTAAVMAADTAMAMGMATDTGMDTVTMNRISTRKLQRTNSPRLL